MIRPTLFAALLLAPPAYASTPSAWAAADRAATRACLAASGLREARVLPGRARFDDRAGYDALLVRGIWPQRHMKGAKGTMLCLWHRSTRRATVVEAPGWTSG